MTPEQQAAVVDAHKRLGQIEGYAGALVIVFTDGARELQIVDAVPLEFKHFLASALLRYAAQLQPRPGNIIIPPGRI